MKGSLATVIFLLLCLNSNAQSYLSVNYGDRLTFTPNYPSLLLKRGSFSPTLVYSYQKQFHSDFSVLFGGQIGIAGYQLVAVTRDTLSGSVDRNPFADYQVFVGRLEVTPGKVFHIGKKALFVGIGGGVSYYRFLFPDFLMGVQAVYQGAPVDLFSAYVEAPVAGTLCGFAKVYMKMAISKRLDLALQYSSHWRSILDGEFEFYHTETPASGSIKLVPRSVSLMLLYRFST
ncbi:MAG: hypothetical protein ABIS36_22690 [Chryseolinea sp.]